jgi:hypothetical protein
MKRLMFFLTLFIQTSCQWIATHPKEDEVIVEAIEKSVEEIYKYETRTLSPGIPPHKIIGPSGPTK